MGEDGREQQKKIKKRQWLGASDNRRDKRRGWRRNDGQGSIHSHMSPNVRDMCLDECVTEQAS